MCSLDKIVLDSSFHQEIQENPVVTDKHRAISLQTRQLLLVNPNTCQDIFCAYNGCLGGAVVRASDF